MKAPALQSNK